MNRFLTSSIRILAIAAVAALLGLAVNAIRPQGGIPVVRPSRAELILREGLVPVHLDTAAILHADTNVLFVDARPANAFRRGRIPRAVNFPSESFDSLVTGFVAKVPLGRPLVVYCDGVECRASEELSKNLKTKGYRFVHCFFGGWVEWRDAGKAIEK